MSTSGERYDFVLDAAEIPGKLLNYTNTVHRYIYTGKFNR